MGDAASPSLDGIGGPARLGGRIGPGRLGPSRREPMLLNGLNHVAVLTKDTGRLQAFYQEVFDATVSNPQGEAAEGPDVRLSFIHIGPFSELNVFEVRGNTEADRQTPMFGR